ncbi:MAG: SRPBCC family protein [Chlorobium sp.]|jgi:carbon monoxide dehydrogenase subunit G|nr:SRPBCC family protein [Chlorobium sp.]
MSFPVNILVEREFYTSCSPQKVFLLLADVPRSASHFPKVDQLVDLGGNAYRWEMEKIGIGSYTLQQTIYACRYNADEDALKVFWTSLPGVGNAIVNGEWNLTPKDGGTRINLKTSGDLTVDFPLLLQFILSPLVVMEFTGMIDRYIANLQESFSKL